MTILILIEFIRFCVIDDIELSSSLHAFSVVAALSVTIATTLLKICQFIQRELQSVCNILLGVIMFIDKRHG